MCVNKYIYIHTYTHIYIYTVYLRTLHPKPQTQKPQTHNGQKPATTKLHVCRPHSPSASCPGHQTPPV